jgi:hypothetical protein
MGPLEPGRLVNQVSRIDRLSIYAVDGHLFHLHHDGDKDMWIRLKMHGGWKTAYIKMV